MRIGLVIGKVTLSRVHPSLVGAQFKLLLPLTFDDLAEPLPIEAADALAEPERDFSVEQRVDAAINRLTTGAEPKDWSGQIVVYDSCSAALGEWLAFSEGAEAAAVFTDDKKPVDAYGAAILDSMQLDYQEIEKLSRAKKQK